MKKIVRNRRLLCFVLLLSVGLLLLAGCSSVDVADGYVLKSVKVVNDMPSAELPDLSSYVRQQPLKRSYSSIRKKGREVFDSIAAKESCRDLALALHSLGYLQGSVELDTLKKRNKIKAVYHLKPGNGYTVGTVVFRIADDSIRKLVTENKAVNNALRFGSLYSAQKLNNVRKQVTALLNDNGYYRFNKEYIEFEVDTTLVPHRAEITMIINRYSASDASHPNYRIGRVEYLDGDGDLRLHLRKSVLVNNTAFRQGELYSNQKLQRTYNNFSRLHAVRYTNIKFIERADSNLLDCNIILSTMKPSSISFQPEGTNTAGDLGAALSLSYENRNIFHGSETFSVQMRGAFEAITGLEGYKDADYQEYGIESKLLFPRLVAPFLSAEARRTASATSELSVSYDLQNRPEFHRRVFSSAWRYRWTNMGRTVNYRFDLIDMNYVYMPWISETFRHDYLESDDNRNAILRYNYEDLLIMKIGFGLSRTKRTFSLRANIESAGNLLNLLANTMKFSTDGDGRYKLFNIAFAQYVKGDFDYTRIVRLDEDKQLLIHGAIGIAYPYGNSSVLPFEKRYFTGGANSLRGWSVRGVGPGTFRGSDGRIDFINQTGDVKLDMSVEYRQKLFWKLSLGAFIDAGNIWTLRNYEEQEGGQFLLSEFYKQLAASYGLGVRINFGYFIMRFDFGMKAVNPAFKSRREHYPLFFPNLSRDLAFHFAVGLPF